MPIQMLESLNSRAAKRAGKPLPHEIRVTIIWNVCWLLNAGFFASFFTLEDAFEIALRVAVFAGAWLLTLLLIVEGYWLTGRYALLATIDLAIWYFTGYLGPGLGVEGFFAAGMMANFLFFSREERLHTGILSVLCLALVVHASLFSSGLFGAPSLPERVSEYLPLLCSLAGASLVLVGLRGLQQRMWQRSDALQHAVEQQDALNQRLEHTLERLNNAVAACPNAIVIADRGGIVHEHNQEFLNLFGYEPGDVSGLSVDQLVPTGQRKAHAGHRQAFLQAPSTRRVGPGRKLLAQRKDGGRFPVDIALGPFQTQEGAFTMAVVADRSAQVEAEELAAQKTAELRHSNAELTQFAYVASHDLQEPLRMVSGYLDLLEEECGPQLGDDALKYLGVARDGALRMQRLIIALLEYSRVGGKGVIWAPVDLQQVTDAVKADLEALIADAGGKVVAGSLPVVSADAEQIRQALQNLVSNALKFRQPGVPPVIHINATVLKNEWLLSVKDNGTGIEPRFQDKVFRVFQRLVHRDEVSGEGIGLAVVKKIVDRHHGRVWFESEVGSGTTFFLKIPSSEELSQVALSALSPQ